MHLFALALALVACAPKSEVDALNEKIKSLEEKVAALEKAPRGGAAASTNPEAEEAAGKLATELMEAKKASDYATAKTKFAELKAKHSDTKVWKSVSRMEAELNLVGSEAKPIDVQKWFTGEKATLSDADTTVLVFWEAWCPHCKREVPKLPELQDKWKSKGVQVVALTKVNKSSTDESVSAFIKEHKLEGLPFGKEQEGGSMSSAYAVTGVPAAAVVKAGKVVWRGHPAQLTDDVLGKLVAG